MSMLRHRFSNERWGGGGPEPPSSLIREFKISQRGRGRERLETIQFNYIV